MIHGLSHYSSNVASSAINYFLDAEYFDKQGKEWKKREPAPEVLEGDPIQVQALCDSLSFRHKYTSGVLSFTKEESELINATPGLKDALIEELRAFTYAGVKNDDCKPLLVVQHSHLDRLELHYLAPRVNLESGLYFNPFPPRYDDTPAGAQNLFIRQNNAFVDHVCEKYGLQNPRDPAVAREVKTPVFEPNKQIRAQVIEAINGLVDAGHVGTRDDMIKFLKEAGADITRKGENYFSFKFPEMKQAIRLEGPLYGEQSGRAIEEKRSGDRERFETERNGAESRYSAVLNERAEKVEERHGKRAAEAEAAREIDHGAESKLRATIDEIKENLAAGSLDDDGIRAAAADFVRENPDLLSAVCHAASSSPAASSGGGGGGESVSDAGVGSTGNKVLDELIRKYHNWRKNLAKKESSGAAMATKSGADNPAVVAYASAATRLCALHLSTYTGFNFIEPSRGRLTLDDMRLYRQSLRDELKAAKEELRDLLAKNRAAEVRHERIGTPIAIAAKVNSDNVGQDFSLKSDKLKELLEREKRERESRRDKDLER